MTTASMPLKKPWHSLSHQFCENGKTMRKLDNDDDDDTQVYKRPWVGLTDEEILQGNKESWVTLQAWQSAVWWAEAKLREKNS